MLLILVNALLSDYTESVRIARAKPCLGTGISPLPQFLLELGSIAGEKKYEIL